MSNKYLDLYELKSLKTSIEASQAKYDALSLEAENAKNRKNSAKEELEDLKDKYEIKKDLIIKEYGDIEY